jgi:hypothetical protein
MICDGPVKLTPDTVQSKSIKPGLVSSRLAAGTGWALGPLFERRFRVKLRPPPIPSNPALSGN